MFAGGGLKWAERQVKHGRYLVNPGIYTTKPTLTGLTCAGIPLPSQNGEILSLLVEPSERINSKDFLVLARSVLAVFHPSPHRATHPSNKNVGKGNDRYQELWSEISINSDFRKYDDGLRLTVDTTAEQIEMAQALLVAAKARGEINFGMHRQSHALMTSFTPANSPIARLNFLDGRDGGYATAAQMMESNVPTRTSCLGH